MISVNNIQNLLKAAGYYDGLVDGIAGVKTVGAVNRVLADNPTLSPVGISRSQRVVASIQIILENLGFEPGKIDGLLGNNTYEAFNQWHDSKPSISYNPNVVLKVGVPTESGVPYFYGRVGENQVQIDLPYEMVLAWDQSKVVKRMTCHKRVADRMGNIFKHTLDHYGLTRIKELRLNQFGGCLNVRRKRGGSKYSMHSWGIAVDIDPINNRLKWGRDKAWLAKPEYNAFWDIVESEGAVSLGRQRNFDWMHFQFAKI